MTSYGRDEMDKTVVLLVLTLTFVIVVADHGQIYQFTSLHDGSNAFNYS